MFKNVPKALVNNTLIFKTKDLTLFGHKKKQRI